MKLELADGDDQTWWLWETGTSALLEKSRGLLYDIQQVGKMDMPQTNLQILQVQLNALYSQLSELKTLLS